MCDTIVALKNSTSTNSVLLAKSADTEVNEAEQIVKYPRREYTEGTAARTTHIKIPQAKLTYEVILGRSFWAWGSELGANERGVSVGNEAAFSQMIGNFSFDTGLLVADTDEAYIINCAGKEWAAKKVSDVYAISNRYQITNDWNLSSLKNDNDSKQNFNELFEDTSKSEGVCASDRENRAQQILEQRKGNISLSDMADIMRDVGEDPDNYEPDKAELKQNFVCMHAKPHPDAFWHATGAMITDSNEEGIVVWMTGTAANDLSIFKPLFFDIPLPQQLKYLPRGTYDKKSFWWKHENLHRKAIMDYKACKPEIRERFDELEKKFFNQSSNLRTSPNKEKIEFTQYCWDEAEKLTDILINNINKKTISLKPGPFVDMWSVFNKEAGFQIAN